MSKRTMSILFVVGLLILVTSVAIFSPQSNTEEPPITETPSTSTPEPDDSFEPDEDESPYDYNARPYHCINPIHDTALNVEGIIINTSTRPDERFVNTIDVGEVINIVLPKQPAEIDISQIRVYGFAHENMKDPFKHTIDTFESPIFVCEFDKTIDGISTQAMIGYKAPINYVLDMLFTYKGKIVYHTLFMTQNELIENKAYWENKYPGETFEAFYFITGDDKQTAYYIPTENLTLLDWLEQVSASQWTSECGAIIDNYHTWMVDQSLNSTVLTPGIEIPTQPYKPLRNLVDFETDNPDYLLSYLHKSEADIIAKFGTPDSRAEKGGVYLLAYTDVEFYIRDDKVEQITLLTNKYAPINYLPQNPCTLAALLALLDDANMIYPEINSQSDVENNRFRSNAPIMMEGWTITYVWDTNTPHNTATDNFTRIIIHTGEQYPY